MRNRIYTNFPCGTRLSQSSDDRYVKDLGKPRSFTNLSSSDWDIKRIYPYFTGRIKGIYPNFLGRIGLSQSEDDRFVKDRGLPRSFTYLASEDWDNPILTGKKG